MKHIKTGSNPVTPTIQTTENKTKIELCAIFGAIIGAILCISPHADAEPNCRVDLTYPKPEHILHDRDQCVVAFQDLQECIRRKCGYGDAYNSGNAYCSSVKHIAETWTSYDQCNAIHKVRIPSK